MFPTASRRRWCSDFVAGADSLEGDARSPLPAGLARRARAPPPRARARGCRDHRPFDVTPPPRAAALTVRPSIEVGGRIWAYREDVVDHAHIPMQIVLQPTSLRLVPVALALPHGRVGYIMGPGDTVADDLAHVGFTVELDAEYPRGGPRGTPRSSAASRHSTRTDLRGGHAADGPIVSVAGGSCPVTHNNRLAAAPPPVGKPFPLTIGLERAHRRDAAMGP